MAAKASVEQAWALGNDQHNLYLSAKIPQPTCLDRILCGDDRISLATATVTAKWPAKKRYLNGLR